MAQSIDRLMEAIGTAIQGTASGAAQKQKAAAENVADVNSLIATIERTYSAETVIQSEKDKNQIALQGLKGRIQGAAGGEEALIKGIEDVTKRSAAVLEATNEVVRKRNRSVFDIVSDPVGTITDMVTLSNSENKLEGAVLQTQAASTALKERHNALTQGFAEAENTKIVTTVAMAQANAEKLASLQQQDVIKARIQGRAYNLEGVNAAMQADASVVSYLTTAENALRAEQQQRIQLQQLADAKIDRDLRRQEAAERADLRKRGEDELAYAFDMVQKGAATTGLQLPSDPRGRQLIAKQALTDERSPFHAYLMRGYRNSSGPGLGGRIGATAADTALIIDNEEVNLPKELAKTTAVLQQAKDLLATSPKTANLDPRKDKAAWSSAYNNAVDEILKIEYAEVRPGSIADFGPSLSSVISSPGIANLPVTTKLLKPLVDSGVPISDPVATLKAGVSAVGSGKLTSNELITGMNAVYGRAALVHTEAMRFQDMGMVPPMAGRTYNVRMDNGKVVNLLDATTLSGFIAAQLRNSIVQNRLNNPFGMN